MSPQQEFLGMLLIACVPAGLIVYARLIWLVATRGGRVKTDAVALPDAMVVTVLAGFLVQLIVKTALHPGAGETPKMSATLVLFNVAIFLGLLLLLLAFLYARRIDPWRFFGLHGLKAGRALVLAFGFILRRDPAAAHHRRGQ